MILATGASQFEVLESLCAQPGIEWDKVTCFHLDEYVGLPGGVAHPASFRKYMRERVLTKIQPKHFVEVDGDAKDPRRECARLADLLKAEGDVDVCFLGIGENGHLAFNDPPADMETEEPFLVVQLDEACRRQQLGEGWFATLEDVPTHALSMGIRQICKSKSIVGTVPDARKAREVADTLGADGPTPQVPATALLAHPDCTLFLDAPAASLIKDKLFA